MSEFDVNDEAPGWPRPSTAFSDYFADPLYRDFADEFAPFGSDEGFEAMAELTRLQPTAEYPLRVALETLHGQEAVEVLDEGDIGETTELDPVVIGLTFGLIWLTGNLDPDGEDLASAAVQRQVDRYGHHLTLNTLLRDLASYRERKDSE